MSRTFLGLLGAIIGRLWIVSIVFGLIAMSFYFAVISFKLLLTAFGVKI